VFTAQVAISTQWMDEIHQAVDFIPQAIDAYARRELRPFASQWVDRTLRREPGPPRYPLQWESERQRRFVMAKLRRENNLPYQRTHAYVAGWHVIGDYTGGLTSITVEHLWAAAQYVGGRRQQRFHRHTGWPNAADELQLLSLAMDERIEAGLPVLIDQVLEGRYDAI
jgi:hypothetical protein